MLDVFGHDVLVRVNTCKIWKKMFKNLKKSRKIKKIQIQFKFSNSIDIYTPLLSPKSCSNVHTLNSKFQSSTCSIHTCQARFPCMLLVHARAVRDMLFPVPCVTCWNNAESQIRTFNDTSREHMDTSHAKHVSVMCLLMCADMSDTSSNSLLTRI